MNTLRKPVVRQEGAVAIVVAAFLVALLGVAGLVIDLGHLFVAKSELQNAADACALAAVRELDGKIDALVRAENAGRAVGQFNRVDFQKEAAAVAPGDVTFSADAGGPYFSGMAGANPVQARFVACTVHRRNIAMTLIRVLGVGAQSMQAVGVAGLTPSQISTPPPAAVCSNGPAPDFGLRVGDCARGLLGATDGSRSVGDLLGEFASCYGGAGGASTWPASDGRPLEGQQSPPPADWRAGLTPVVDCNLSPSQRKILGWVCAATRVLDATSPGSGVAAFKILGLNTGPGGICAATGQPGGTESAGPLVPALVH